MFSVYKPRDAMAEVVSAWENADAVGRYQIERAMVRLERSLQRKPRGLGESRGDGKRVLFRHPLALEVVIDKDARMVRVVRAWTFTRQAAA